MLELDEDVAEIVEEFDHGRVRGTKRTGRLSRGCSALAIPARLKLSMVSRVVSEMAAAPLIGVKSNSGWPSRALFIAANRPESSGTVKPFVDRSLTNSAP